MSDKALSANETQSILHVLNKKMTIKDLILDENLIGDGTNRIIFPQSLLKLSLRGNKIGDQGAKDL